MDDLYIGKGKYKICQYYDPKGKRKRSGLKNEKFVFT